MSINRGLDTLKTAGSAHLHSIPSTHRSGYLDLFMLEKEKNKLEKDSKKIEKRLKHNLNRLKEIETQMEEVLATQVQEKGEKKESKTRSKEANELYLPKEQKAWETVKLRY